MKKTIVTGMAIVIILLLGGCELVGKEDTTDPSSNVPSGANDSETPDAEIPKKAPTEVWDSDYHVVYYDYEWTTPQFPDWYLEYEFSDPDTEAWAREFAQEFLDFLQEPYTPLKESGPLWYNLYGDIKAFDREKTAWEKQNITNYTWRVEHRRHREEFSFWNTPARALSPGPRPPEFSKWYWEHISARGYLPSYVRDISIGDERIISTENGYDSQALWYVSNVASVYQAIAKDIERLTHRETWNEFPVDGEYSRLRAGFKIDYHPVYHYPQRLMWIEWKPDFRAKLGYHIWKALYFEPLEARSGGEKDDLPS